VRAGLERHEHGCPAGIVATALGVGQRCALRVEPAEPRVPTLADHLLVARDNAAHERVRRNRAPPELGQLEGSLQVAPILFGLDKLHHPERTVANLAQALESFA